MLGRGGSGGNLQPGDRIGPYLLEAPLGEGGMGIVFRAVRGEDGQVVALKVLRGELSHDETYRRRLLHEARAAGEVRHKHLVPVLDAGEAEDRSYLAVAYVSGRSLEERIRADGPLPLPELVRLTSQVAAGLDALHQAAWSTGTSSRRTSCSTRRATPRSRTSAWPRAARTRC